MGKAIDYAETELEHVRRAIPILSDDDQAFLQQVVQSAWQAGYLAAAKGERTGEGLAYAANDEVY